MQQSDKIDLIAKALRSAQAEMPHAAFDGENKFFKKADGTNSRYATMKSIISAWDEVADKHGLSYTQMGSVIDGLPVLCTQIMHESGQWIRGEYLLTAKQNDPQSLGSAMTYARRYCLAAAAGIIADDDDDGNAAQGLKPAEKPAKVPEPPKPENPHAKLAKDLHEAFKKAKNVTGVTALKKARKADLELLQNEFPEGFRYINNFANQLIESFGPDDIPVEFKDVTYAG